MVNEKRLIDVKPLMENGWHLVKTGNSNVFLAQMSLADVPTVDAVEVVHGKWIKGDGLKNAKFIPCSGILYCSNCKNEAYWDTDYGQQKFDYCPNCGAKMDGDGNG